ncbi:MAG: TolC family protein [Verrucomicrobiota bacterium]
MKHWLGCLAGLWLGVNGLNAAVTPQAVSDRPPLQLEEVLLSVRGYYPPLLASWIQQDIANGRVRQSIGAFDTILSSSLVWRPENFYDGSNAELLIEQPLPIWGGSVYGGYRRSSGFFADYERKLRTAEGGEGVLGFKVPLLRGGPFDNRRAARGKAEIERELADPFILRQYLDFIRGARISYYEWVAKGQRLAVAEEILNIALERDKALEEQKQQGAIAPIVQVDNQRLVVNRQIAVFQARRGFEQAAIKLSLFLRKSGNGEPIVAGRELLPQAFPEQIPLSEIDIINDSERAAFNRPEVRQIGLLFSRAEIDKRLAGNNLKPNLDLAFELNRAIGNDRPKDIDPTEIAGLIQFSLPIGRNEAQGRIEAIDGEIARLEQEKKFAREKILADAQDSYSAVRAALGALGQTKRNVDLSIELEKAENQKFKEGASDLLAVQIREEATFNARNLEINAKLAYFQALANYKAAVAEDAPANLLPKSSFGALEQ